MKPIHRHSTQHTQKLPLSILLQYEAGTLSPEQQLEVETYLEDHVDDQVVIEGVRKFYELEQTGRKGLEDFLEAAKTDTAFLFDDADDSSKKRKASSQLASNVENHKSPGKPRKRPIFFRLGLIAASVACLMMFACKQQEFKEREDQLSEQLVTRKAEASEFRFKSLQRANELRSQMEVRR
ncbi:MAG: hypothetical protein AAF587_15495 [Bacteroidota bacterium]